MRRNAVLACLSAAAVMLGMVWRSPAGGPLPVQYQTQPPASGALGLISRTAPGGQFTFTNRRVADNFRLQEGARLLAVTWWGGMESSEGSASNVASFTIEFFDDTGPNGAPGASVAATTVAAVQVSSAPVVPAQTVGLLNAPMFIYSAFLPAGGIELQGGRTYWVSIAASLVNDPDPSNEAWTWSSGVNTTNDQLIAQDRFDGQGFQLRTLTARNTAFALLGNPVAPPCFGDANGDNIVNGADLSVLLAGFGESTGAGPSGGDFNADGQINGADLSILLSQFGTAC